MKLTNTHEKTIVLAKSINLILVLTDNFLRPFFDSYTMSIGI